MGPVYSFNHIDQEFVSEKFKRRMVRLSALMFTGLPLAFLIALIIVKGGKDGSRYSTSAAYIPFTPMDSIPYRMGGPREREIRREIPERIVGRNYSDRWLRPQALELQRSERQAHTLR